MSGPKLHHVDSSGWMGCRRGKENRAGTEGRKRRGLSFLKVPVTQENSVKQTRKKKVEEENKEEEEEKEK